MNYDSLLEEAFEYGIKIKEINLKTSDGMCCGNRIAINKRLKTDREKYCVLAEELGHYHLTIGDISDQKKITNRKQEKIARNWAYKKLVGITELINAFNKGVKHRYELAEYLNVTEEFLDEAIQYYREKYGLCYEIDNYLVYFEPRLGILKIF